MKEPRKLTTSELRDMRNLVKICANYDKTYDCCALLDDYGCYMLCKRLADNKLCKYFANAVLPLNPELEWAFIGKVVNHTKICAICSHKFVPKGRQAYCSPKCRKEGMKIKEREKKRKQRQNGG